MLIFHCKKIQFSFLLKGKKKSLLKIKDNIYKPSWFIFFFFFFTLKGHPIFLQKQQQLIRWNAFSDFIYIQYLTNCKQKGKKKERTNVRKVGIYIYIYEYIIIIFFLLIVYGNNKFVGKKKERKKRTRKDRVSQSVSQSIIQTGVFSLCLN